MHLGWSQLSITAMLMKVWQRTVSERLRVNRPPGRRWSVQCKFPRPMCAMAQRAASKQALARGTLL